MVTPEPLRAAADPVVLRERWARPRWAVNVMLIVGALLVPGTTGVLLAPDNPREGWIALALGMTALAWQGHRVATSGVALSGYGVGRAGPTWLGRGRLTPWTDVVDVHWHSTHVARDRHGFTNGSTRLHLLRLTTSTGTRPLTRYQASDDAAERLNDELRELGIDMPVMTPPPPRR
jgi:hypothetical protein